MYDVLVNVVDIVFDNGILCVLIDAHLWNTLRELYINSHNSFARLLLPLSFQEKIIRHFNPFYYNTT